MFLSCDIDCLIISVLQAPIISHMAWALIDPCCDKTLLGASQSSALSPPASVLSNCIAKLTPITSADHLLLQDAICNLAHTCPHIGTHIFSKICQRFKQSLLSHSFSLTQHQVELQLLDNCQFSNTPLNFSRRILIFSQN